MAQAILAGAAAKASQLRRLEDEQREKDGQDFLQRRQQERASAVSDDSSNRRGGTVELISKAPTEVVDFGGAQQVTTHLVYLPLLCWHAPSGPVVHVSHVVLYGPCCRARPSSQISALLAPIQVCLESGDLCFCPCN